MIFTPLPLSQYCHTFSDPLPLGVWPTFMDGPFGSIYTSTLNLAVNTKNAEDLGRNFLDK